MASIPPILVGDVGCPTWCPAEAWEDVVSQIGHLVVGSPRTRRGEGKVLIGFKVIRSVMKRVQAIIRAHAPFNPTPTPTPWVTDPSADSWNKPGDWWR